MRHLFISSVRLRPIEYGAWFMAEGGAFDPLLVRPLSHFVNLLMRRYTNIRSSFHSQFKTEFCFALLLGYLFFQNFFFFFTSSTEYGFLISIFTLLCNLVPFHSKLSNEHDLFVFNDIGPISVFFLSFIFFLCILNTTLNKIESKDCYVRVRIRVQM